MKYSGIKKIVTFYLAVFFYISTSLCLAKSPWDIFDGVKSIGSQYNSARIEKLTSEINSYIMDLKGSMLFSATECVDMYCPKVWNVLVSSLNKYYEEVNEENQDMYCKPIDLVNVKK